MRGIGAAQTILLSLITAVCASGQGDVAALKDRLHRAAVQSSLDTGGMSPWHLKMTVQLYDAKGKPTADQGTIEEWWLGSSSTRVVYALPHLQVTEVVDATGRYRTKSAAAPGVLLRLLLDQVVHAVPSTEVIDNSSPELQTQDLGKALLDCVVLTRPMTLLTPIPLGLFPTYCFETGKDTLRVAYDFSSQVVERNSLTYFKGHRIANSIMLKENGIQSASAKIVTLEDSDAEAAKTNNVDGLVADTTEQATRSTSVVAPALLTTIPPTYPTGHQDSGTVVVQAIVGRDGRIHCLRVAEAANAEFAAAVVTAVKVWNYKPSMLHGEAIEANTTITVDFKPSRGDIPHVMIKEDFGVRKL